MIEPTFEGRRIEDADLARALLLMAMYCAVVLLSWFTFLAYGHAPMHSLFEVASATATVGLSTGLTSPTLEPLLKAVLGLDMLLGRLEIVAAPGDAVSGNLDREQGRILMRVVFIGASSLAVVTAKLMRERGEEVVIIEHDKDHIDALTEELDCGFLHGDGSKPAILREADPEWHRRAVRADR